jgi:hypothetical protein
MDFLEKQPVAKKRRVKRGMIVESSAFGLRSSSMINHPQKSIKRNKTVNKRGSIICIEGSCSEGGICSWQDI